VTSLSDDALRTLIREDPAAGWRAFIDQYTPLLVGLIRRAGLDDRDEVMEVYVTVCERLTERDFARLKSQDAARGSIGGWLAVMTRHAAVDWIRSKKGRRRLFQAVRDLPPLDRRVFELYYWDERMPSEICEIEKTTLAAVFDSLERIQSALTDRHRAELIALALRSKQPVALDDTDAPERVADSRPDAESALHVAEVTEQFESALRSLPAEDAAIVRLKYVEGLATSDIEHALGTAISRARVESILGRLREALSKHGITASERIA